MKKQIKIGVGASETTAKGFIEAWKRAERGEKVQEKNMLHFENLEVLLKTLTPGRWSLLKKLHAKGALSIRALATELKRDYKNVHTDVRLMENVGLIGRSEDDRILVPWDIVEARLLLAA